MQSPIDQSQSALGDGALEGVILGDVTLVSWLIDLLDGGSHDCPGMVPQRDPASGAELLGLGGVMVFWGDGAARGIDLGQLLDRRIGSGLGLRGGFGDDELLGGWAAASWD